MALLLTRSHVNVSWFVGVWGCHPVVHVCDVLGTPTDQLCCNAASMLVLPVTVCPHQQPGRGRSSLCVLNWCTKLNKWLQVKHQSTQRTVCCVCIFIGLRCSSLGYGACIHFLFHWSDSETRNEYKLMLIVDCLTSAHLKLMSAAINKNCYSKPR